MGNVMHAGMVDYVGLEMVMVAVFALMWFKRLPTPDGWERFLHSIDSPGAKVLILMSATLFFGMQTIKMLWHLVELVRIGSLKGSEGVVEVTETFMISNLTTVFVGALINTLNGNSKPNGGLLNAPKTIDSTITTTTHVDPAPPAAGV